MSEPVDEVVEEPPPSEEPAPSGPSAPLGAKLFVIFFMIIVPPLGIALLIAVVWSLWKLVMSGA